MSPGIVRDERQICLLKMETSSRVPKNISVVYLHFHTKRQLPVICRNQLRKGKISLFNTGGSFSYETGINGSRRCALDSLASVLRFTDI